MIKESNDAFWLLPDETKSELTQVVTDFCLKTGAEVEDVQKFISQIIKIYVQFKELVLTQKLN